MDKRLKPEDLKHSFDIEDLFNIFVEKIGGELVDKLLPSSPNFENADYLFRKDSVIIELKCLQNDFPSNSEFQDKIVNLYRRWFKEESISFNVIFHPAKLQEEKKQEILKLHLEPIRRVIKKANRQLRKTADYFEMPKSRKLLLIASDGLYSLSPPMLLSILCEILQKEFSSIDGFVYFTLNKYVDIPNNDYACELCVPYYNENSSNTDIVEFVNSLGRKWGDFISERIGGLDWREETEDASFLKGTNYIK